MPFPHEIMTALLQINDTPFTTGLICRAYQCEGEGIKECSYRGVVDLKKYLSTIMSHIVSKTSDIAYIGLTALWALVVDAQKVRISIYVFIVIFIR